MKTLAGTFTLISLLCATAFAGNSTVEDAIKDREELSKFYEALQKTGVLNELDEGTSYAVFAPTNEAFEKIYGNKKYPCFGHEECQQDFTEVIRNHFVPGFYDLGRQNGLFAINNRQLTVGHPHRGHDSVDGNMVESVSQLVGSVIYEIDGVIMNENEGKMFRVAPHPAAAKSDKPQQGIEGVSSPAR